MKPDEGSNASETGATRRSSRKRQQVQAKDETVPATKNSTSKRKRGPTNAARALVKSETTSATSRPTPEECYYVTEALSQLHPHIVNENNKRRKSLLEHLSLKSKSKSRANMNTPVTNQIIGTMLSQNTTDANCHKAFATLKKDFPGGWEEVAIEQDITRIETSIKVAGLAKIRAQRIQGMLQSIQQERGEASFEYLQDYESNEEIVRELSRFKGMGPKTISCVLLFALGRADFPVDTHVLRITQQMNWVGKAATRESAYEHFKDKIPGDCMMDLHCLIVEHGKVCFSCAANGRPQFPPKVGKKGWVCPLVGIKSGDMEFGDAIKVKSEPVQLEGSDRKIKVEETESGVAIKLKREDVSRESSNSMQQIKAEDTTSDIAIEVEKM